MKVAVSFHGVDGQLYDDIKEYFFPNYEIEIYGRNLTNHFKRGPSELHSDLAKLNDRLSNPDLILVLLSSKYMSEEWFTNELAALINLEQYRNEEGKLVLIVLTDDVRFVRLQHALQNRVNQSIDFRGDRSKAMYNLFEYILGTARNKRLEVEDRMRHSQRKGSEQSSPDARVNISYHLHGHSRVNNSSQDSSVNISHQISEVFADVRQAIQGGIKNDEERARILDKLTELENAKGTPSFIDKYREFMATAANHVETIAPFLPALSQMLGG